MSRKSFVSLTRIRKVLKAIVFNPRTDREKGIIADVGNCDYYEEEAILLIRKAQSRRRTDGVLQNYSTLLIQAIRLLILAIIYGTEESKTSR